MAFPDSARIATVQVIDSGVFIEFTDGQSAFFDRSFILAHRPWFMLDHPSDTPSEDLDT